MLKSVGNRVRMVHLKDRKPGFANSQTLNKAAEHFTEVGTGTLDFKAIAEAARSIGVEHYFVEQDEISKPVFESLTTSFQNAERLLS
jgi:sugar phosphate isomerase/epimerase